MSPAAGGSAAAPNGILLVDKPRGMTSHDVVARVRSLVGTRKVGHAGTLDPMADGLLILGIGASTRLLTFMVGADKEYFATIRLGASTTTDDAEGELVETADARALAAVDDAAVRGGIGALTGEIDQVPSSVSAIKVDGKRAYARVRAGEGVRLAARRVTVSAFEVLSLERAGSGGAGTIDIRVRVECSSGTYIRALARDLGAGLGVGGHLTALRRTRAGPFTLADAASLDDPDAAGRMLRPALAASALFPVLTLTADESVDLANGKRLTLEETRSADDLVAAVAPDGRLVGIAEVKAGRLRSVANFPTSQGAADASAGTKELP